MSRCAEQPRDDVVSFVTYHGALIDRRGGRGVWCRPAAVGRTPVPLDRAVLAAHFPEVVGRPPGADPVTDDLVVVRLDLAGEVIAVTSGSWFPVVGGGVRREQGVVEHVRLTFEAGREVRGTEGRVNGDLADPEVPALTHPTVAAARAVLGSELRE